MQWGFDALGWGYSLVFLFLSFTLVALIVMNLLTARRENVCPIALVEAFEAHVNERKLQDAYELARADDSFLGQVLSAGLAKLSSGYSQVIEAMQEVGEPGPHRDLHALVPLNRAFHGRLVGLAGRPSMAAALAGAVHAPIVVRNFHAYDEESLARSLAHHVEIVAALRAGDAVWAAAIMTAHIHNARAVMVRGSTVARDPAAAEEGEGA